MNEQLTSALSRLEQLVKDKQVRRDSLAYASAIEALKNPGIDIVCGSHTGSGRFAGSKSWAAQTAAILAKTGVMYRIHNVAPKRGKAGDRIQVTNFEVKTNYTSNLVLRITRAGINADLRYNPTLAVFYLANDKREKRISSALALHIVNHIY